jgi:mannosyltransferase OCH1-like enzyme
MKNYEKLYQYRNKNIFQVAINLRDNLPNLLSSRKKVLSLNPEWNHFLITSQQELNHFMEFHFRDSDDEFDRKIYDCFEGVRSQVAASPKSWAQIHETLFPFIRAAKAPKLEDLAQALPRILDGVSYFRSIHEVCRLVSQTDVFRLAAVFKFGGIYFDLSSSLECNFNEKFQDSSCAFIQTPAEIRTSMIYGKEKHNAFIKKLIQHIYNNCFVEKIQKQYQLAGPGALTKFFKRISNPEEIQNLNVKIFQEKDFKEWIMDAEWKQDLHTPDPNNPNQQINHHWHFNNY